MRLILLLGSVMLFCMSTALQAESLKGEALKAAFSGKSGTWERKDGTGKGSISYGADGQARITGRFGKQTQDRGVWRISGDQICLKWTYIRGGKEGCFSITRLPDGRLEGNEVIVSFK